MRHRSGAALFHGQSRLRTVERLNLALFIDAEHDRLLRRVHIEADDILHFGSKRWIVGDLEGARQMRLETMLSENPLHAGVADATNGRSQHANAPVRRVPGAPFDSGFQNLAFDVVSDGLLAGLLRLVLEQSLDAGIQKALRPAPDRRF